MPCSIGSWTSEGLKAFEKEIAAEFEAGRIAAPVHLAGGNESQLIEIFRSIGPRDWKLCTWRAHYHALLSGVPAEEVKAAILRGRSIGLCFPEQRLLSSAIVGGICPIAVGLAWSIKRRNGAERVHAFIGDMAAETGIYHECAKYCARHALPVRWIIEDNGKSVCTDTQSSWGARSNVQNVERYAYELEWPHVGTGVFVRF